MSAGCRGVRLTQTEERKTDRNYARIDIDWSWTKKTGSVGRFFFTMVLLSTLTYCTRFRLCCLLVTLYFDMFCYRKNDLDDDKQLELQ